MGWGKGSGLAGRVERGASDRDGVKRSEGVEGVSWGGGAWEGCREHWDIRVEVG